MDREKFIAIRTYLGLNQPDFGKYFGISSSNVGMIESGNRKVSQQVKAKIAKKFEETDDFISFYERVKKLSK